MALEFQNIPFGFDAGIDQEIDSQVLDPQSGMGTVENGVFRKLGRIEKRFPMAEALDRETVTAGASGGVGFSNEQSHTLLPTRPSLAVQAGATQRAHNEAGQRLKPGIMQHSAEVERIDIWYNQLQALLLDSTVVNGYIVSVYQTEGVGILRAVEVATGQVVFADNIQGNVTDQYMQCRVERAGDLAMVFCASGQDFGTGGFDTFNRFTLDLSDPSNITLTSLGSIAPFVAFCEPFILPLPYAFDTSSDDAGNVYLIFNEGGVGRDWILFSYDNTGAQTSTTSLASPVLADNFGPPSIYAAGGLTDVFVIVQPPDGNAINVLPPTMFRFPRILSGGGGSGPFDLLNPFETGLGTNMSGLYLAIGMVISEVSATPNILVALDAAWDQCRILEVPYTLGVFNENDGVPGRLMAKPHFQRVGNLIYPIFTVQKPRSYSPITGQPVDDDNEELDAQPNILLVVYYDTEDLDNLEYVPIAEMVPFGRFDVLDALTDSPLSNFPTPTAMTEGEEASNDISKWHIPYLVRGATSNKLIEVVSGTPADFTMQFQAGCASVMVDYTLELPLARTELGDAVYTGAACLQSFAGDLMIRESSFHFRPILWPSSLEAQNIPAGSLGVGDYTYVILFERFDSNGDLIRSEVSRSAVVTVAANESVRLTFHSPLYYSGAKDSINEFIRVKIFRSEVDGANPLFLREFRDAGNNFRGEWGRFGFSDTVADVDLVQELPYPFGQNGLQNNPSPAPYHHTEWRNRMVIVNNQDRDELWISNVKGADAASNRLGVEFSGQLTVRIAAGPGDIEAVASIDEKLIIFKPSSIYMIVGEGPNNGGLGGSFSQPIERSSQVGCINKRSVITTEVGIFFQSRGGIQLLDRSMQLDFVGHGVTDFLPGTSVGGAALIKRAALISELKEVRFLLDDADQTVLCYHYRFQRWSTLKYFDIATRNSVSEVFRIQDIVSYQGRFHALVLDGLSGLSTVYREADQAAYQDGETGAFAGTTYQMTLTTPDFKLANLTGFQRIKNVRFLMDYIAAHDLKIDIAYNEDSTNLAPYTFDDADIVSTDTSSYVVRIKPGQGKSRSIRFRLRDQLVGSTAPSTGAGFRAIQLSMEAAVKRGGFRIGATNKR